MNNILFSTQVIEIILLPTYTLFVYSHQCDFYQNRIIMLIYVFHF